MDNIFEDYLKLECQVIDLRNLATTFDTQVMWHDNQKALWDSHLALIDKLHEIEIQCVNARRKALRNVWAAYSEIDTENQYGK